MIVKNIFALTFTLLSCLAFTQPLVAMPWEEAENNVSQIDQDRYTQKFVKGFDSHTVVSKSERNERERAQLSALQKIRFGIMRRNTAQQVTENIFSNDAVKTIRNTDLLSLIGDYAQETHYSLSDNQFAQGGPAARYEQSLPAHKTCVAYVKSIESHTAENGIENLVLKSGGKDWPFLIKPEYTSIARTCLWDHSMNWSPNSGTMFRYDDSTGYLVLLLTTNKNDARYRYIQIDNPSSSRPTLQRLGFFK